MVYNMIFKKFGDAVSGGFLKAKQFARDAPRYYSQAKDLGRSVSRGIDIVKGVSDAGAGQQVRSQVDKIYNTKNDYMKKIEDVDSALKKMNVI